MWWETQAVNLLLDMGLTRTSAVSLVAKIKTDSEMTASEAGMWARVVTILGGAAVIASVVAPRPSTARVMSEVTAGHARMLRVATGYREKCERQYWYPIPGKGNRWDLITCPYDKGHKGLHGDVNHFPLMAEEDIAFFDYQHKLATE